MTKFTRIIATAALVFGLAAPASAAGRQAPEFSGVNQWLNSGPLTMAGLRGKVVLVDFWTQDCINCIRTLPHVTALYSKYASRGLVIVGVHTPEFPREKVTANVEAAIKRFGIRYPVAQDNAFSTWNAYNNEFWPAQYIVDRSGKIVYMHAGEDAYGEMDRVIGNLLDEAN